MSTFDLRIRFEGLVMWVPEGKTAMHVLMPLITGEHHKNHKNKRKEETERPPDHDGEHPRGEKDEEEIPEHMVRVVVDQAYLATDQKQLKRNLFMVDLAGRVLDLTGLSWDGIETSVPDEIPSLDGVVDPLKPAIVTGKPVPPIAARVIMDAGAMTNYEMGPPFAFLGKERRITGVTEWTIRGVRTRRPAAQGGALCLRGTQVLAHEEGRTDLPDLFPIGNIIQLTVMYLVRNDFPPHGKRFQPQADDPDFHFDAYFEVAPPKGGGENPEPPVPAQVLDIVVDGDRVEKDAGEIPLSICGNVKVSLASA